MADNWHYGRKGHQFGPVTDAQLRQLAASGQLLQTDLVWKKGMPQWVKAGQIKGLFPPTRTPVQKHDKTPQVPPPKEQEQGFDIETLTASAPSATLSSPSSAKHSPSPPLNTKKKRNPLFWLVVLCGSVIAAAGLVMAFSPFGKSGDKSIPTDYATSDHTYRAAQSDTTNTNSEPTPQPEPHRQATPLTPYYSPGSTTELEPQGSWSFDTITTFSHPDTSTYRTVILLDADTYAYGGAHFPVTICTVGTNDVLATADAAKPPSFSLYHSESAQCILWTSGIHRPTGAILYAWNYRTKTTQTRLEVQPASDDSTHSTEGTYSPDQTLIATALDRSLCGSDRQPVRIWNATTVKKLYEANGWGPVAFSLDGSLLAFEERKDTFRGCVLWDYKADKKTILRRPDNKYVYTDIRALAFVPDTQLLAVLTTDNNRIELWDSQTHRFLAELKFPEKISTMTSNPIAVSKDGTYLIAGVITGVALCHLPTGRIAMLRGKGPFFSVSVSADGRRIAASNDKNQVAFWSKRSGGTGEFAFDVTKPSTQSTHGSGDPKRNANDDAIKCDAYFRVEEFASQVAHDPIEMFNAYQDKEIAVTGSISSGDGETYKFSGGAACVFCTLAEELPYSIMSEHQSTFIGRFEKYERHPSGYWVIYLTQARHIPSGQGGRAHQGNRGIGNSRPRRYSRAEFLVKLISLGGQLGHTFPPSNGEPGYRQVVYSNTFEVWLNNFGEPEQLSDGTAFWTSGGSYSYQRWRYMCTDGPLTFHGNILRNRSRPQAEARLNATQACYY